MGLYAVCEQKLAHPDRVLILAWRSRFEGELKTGVTCMEATFWSCTMPCSEAICAFDGVPPPPLLPFFPPLCLRRFIGT